VTHFPEAAFHDFTARTFGKRDIATGFLAPDKVLHGMRNAVRASDHEPKKQTKNIPVYDKFNQVKKKQSDMFKGAQDEMGENQ
jgi:hypothetical protein